MNRSTLPLLLLLATFFITDRVLAATEQKTRFASVYQVIEDTTVYRRPSENAEQIASIPAGTRVNVFNDHGDWVEIFSRHGRPPGYIKKASLAITESSSSERTETPNEFPRNPQVSSLRSKESLIRTEIEFTNRLSTVIAIYWVDFQGNEISFGDLDPGSSKVIQTFATHPWRVRDKTTGQLVKTVVVGPRREFVAIDEATPEIQPTGKASPANEEKQPGSVADVRFTLFEPYRAIFEPYRAIIDENACGIQIYVFGQVPPALDLSGDSLSSYILDKGKEYALMRCPKARVYIQVYLYQTPFDIRNWEKDWFVHATYYGSPSNLYKAGHENRAQRKELEELKAKQPEAEQAYIQRLRESISWHGPRFLGIFENIPIYEASFTKRYNKCFVLDVGDTQMTFCQPPGTIIKFHAVVDGGDEPVIVMWAMHQNQQTEMGFRASKFRYYGDVSFREVGRKIVLTPEIRSFFNGVMIVAGLLIMGIIVLIANSQGGASSSVGVGASSGGSSGGTSDIAEKSRPYQDAVRSTHRSRKEKREAYEDGRKEAKDQEDHPLTYLLLPGSRRPSDPELQKPFEDGLSGKKFAEDKKS